MDYHFREIEPKWRKFWALNHTYKAKEDGSMPTYYILDMFPYPSGAGLHVGHPLGYIATDILARFKRLKGFNVLHPMGYDAFGLPAEQYAIQTGQHPAVTTEENIKRYREQLDQIGFSFDWSREVRTSDPSFYKWTQWIFLQLFDSWYDLSKEAASPLSTLIEQFKKEGNIHIRACCDECETFTANDWNGFTEKQKQERLMKYRMAFLADSYVNWCAGLGTVLANEEVKDGFSERGHFPVERKLMRQWSLRITAYAERLLLGLDAIDWPDALKEMQRHWIGRSEGALVRFSVPIQEDRHAVEGKGTEKEHSASAKDSSVEVEVFTTRPDTIFGCTFLVLAPELDMVKQLCTAACLPEVERYIHMSAQRSERERMADVKSVSGVFTGAYAVHPFTNRLIPVWIADYVLAGYGTGAVMAVPAGDERDFRFAKQFNLPVVPILQGYTDKECYSGKEGTLMNSGFLNGTEVTEALTQAINAIEERGIGKRKIQYRLRDAGFSRQRYWGEPFPIYYKEGIPYALKEEELPLLLPEVDKYLPTETGEAPLGRAKNWQTSEGYPYETNTMPGWAGSSWYYLRYMDAHNKEAFASREKLDYWKQVDLYMGGSEHATGHLLYVRFWTKFLFDRGYISIDEPAARLVNQGMIQGRSNFVYRLLGTNLYFSSGHVKKIEAKENAGLKAEACKILIEEQLGEVAWEYASHKIVDIQTRGPVFQAVHVDVNIVENDILDLSVFKKGRGDGGEASFILENGHYLCGHEVEKMSKSKMNVVNPDDIVYRYGADTLRMYEMFLGPLELAKPWNTNGIEGVFKFLRKLWKLFHDESLNFSISEEAPSEAEYRALHKLIKKVEDDIERLSFNTSVSSFMICVNELVNLKCNKRAILDPLVRVLSPFAPHISEELWEKLGHEAGSISKATYPTFHEAYLTESSFDYPVSLNGKVKFNLKFSLDKEPSALEEEVLRHEDVQKLLDGKRPKKVIVIKGRIINIVV